MEVHPKYKRLQHAVQWHVVCYDKTGLWDCQRARSHSAHGHTLDLRPPGSPESTHTEHHDADRRIYALHHGRAGLLRTSELQGIDSDSGHCYGTDDTAAEAVLRREGVCRPGVYWQNLRGWCV